MTQYRSRFDHVQGFSMLDLERYLNKYATSYCLVRHEPKKDNVHYHAWFETTYADVTVRMMLTKMLPYLKGNGGHSIQDCDPLRHAEYKQYLFNRKYGNLATFVKEVNVPDWEDYQRKANEATVEYIKTKKVFSKNDCIETLLAMPKEWTSDEELFRAVMTVARQRKTVFSINAIRDIIVTVGYHNGTQETRSTMEHAVLKVFRPFTPN